MNELYNLFNPQYVNQEYINRMNIQQYENRQSAEIIKAVKALQDFFEAAKKIDVYHQEAAFYACLAVIAKENNWR